MHGWDPRECPLYEQIEKILQREIARGKEWGEEKDSVSELLMSAEFTSSLK